MVAIVLDRPGAPTVPPLANGDNLTRDEFERRWALHPEIKHAERIDGIVYIELSVGREHGIAHSLVNGWLFTYASTRPGLELADNTTVRLGDNDLQPDLYLRRREPRDRHSPELVFEVAATSASSDLHQKFDVYERHGVAEYVVWRVFDAQLDWFGLRDGRYERREADADGVIESELFPGLRLHVASLLAGDVPALLAALRPPG
ncbi:MAG: Uma2 family endonuclease [Dehalococcoidia bacterium]